MLWDHYVFRRGNAVHDLWDDLMKDRPVDLLYIAGRGFDVRAQTVMREFVTGAGWADAPKAANRTTAASNDRRIMATSYGTATRCVWPFTWNTPACASMDCSCQPPSASPSRSSRAPASEAAAMSSRPCLVKCEMRPGLAPCSRTAT